MHAQTVAMNPRREAMIAAAMAIVLILLLCAMSPGQTRWRSTDWPVPYQVAAQQGYWQWSQPAAHHRAAVQVSCNTSSAGSGVYVQQGGVYGILTAHHVLEGSTSATITWADGSRTKIADRQLMRIDKDGHDVGLILLDKPHRTIRPLPIAQREPRQGETLEVLGYGGPSGHLRHYTMSYIGGSGSQYALGDGRPTSGDSGGAVLILTPTPAVISVVSAGDDDTGARVIIQSQPWPVYRGLLFPRPGPVRRFVRRVVQSFGQCRPSGCPPQYQPQPQISIYPPQRATPSQPEPILPDDPGPLPNRIVNCECGERWTANQNELEELRERIATLEARPLERGPVGPRGPAGPPGAAADADAIAERAASMVSATIAERDQELAASIRASLPPITVRHVDPRTGQEISRVDKRLGETLTLEFSAGDPRNAQPAQ